MITNPIPRIAAIPDAGLPPAQIVLRNRTLPPDSEWRDFTLGEIEQTVPERLAQMVALYADRVAVKDPVRSFTYAELDRAANQVARALLRDAGSGREPVPYLFHVDARRTPAVHGILRAGKPILGLDAADAPDRLTYLIEFAGATAVITGHDTVELAESLVPRGCRVVDIDAVLLESPGDPVLVASTPDDIAAIIHTSGSTGWPKAVVNSHRALLGRLRGHIVYDLCAPGERITTIGLRSGDISYPLAGATYLPFPIRQEGLHSFAQWLEDEKVTRISAVASGFRQFLDILQAWQAFPQVRAIRITSEPALSSDMPAIARAFPNSILIHALTLSEGGWITCYFVDPQEPPEEPVPIGYVVEDKEAWLEDEAGNAIAAGERATGDGIGEIVVSGRTLGDGYWNSPKLTDEVFRDDPRTNGRRIYATGDLGRFRPDGALIHLGRKDLQLKIRGYRVEVGEVEAGLRTLPGVEDVAVRDWTDERGERYLAAYIVPSATVSTSSLRSVAAAYLPEYMAPRAYVLLDELPRLSNGKVDRRGLPEPERTRPSLATPYVAPDTPLEARLAGIWAEVLDLDHVGVDDRFTDLGGHSLAAVRLLAALDEFTEMELPFSVMLEAGTVRELARVLEDGDWVPQWSSLVQVQPGDGRTPMFVAPAAASTSLSLVAFAKELGAEQGVYGFDAPGLDGLRAPLDTVDGLAAHYIEEMRRLQPEGPYLLGGRCFGALVAVEMARQLEEQGESVPLVAVLDSGALRQRTIRRRVERRRAQWRFRRQESSPLAIVWQALSRRTRISMRGLKTDPHAVPHAHKRTRQVRRAHRRARDRYVARQIHSRLVVYMSREYANKGYNRDWCALAAGEYVEEVCSRRTHRGFLDDAETLRHVCEHLRGQLGDVWIELDGLTT